MVGMKKRTALLHFLFWSSGLIALLMRYGLRSSVPLLLLPLLSANYFSRVLSIPSILLPLDVVIEIVVEFVGPFHEDPERYDERKFTAGSVCRMWRAGVQSAHILWASAYIDNYMDPIRLAQSLDRAGSLPLHLHIQLLPWRMLPARGRFSLRLIDAFLITLGKYLTPYMSRCSCLTINTDDPKSTHALLAFLDSLPFPQLKRLVIRLSSMDALATTPAFTACQSALQKLTFSGGFVLPPRMCSELSGVFVTDLPFSCWQLCVTALATSTRLTTLDLRNVECVALQSIADLARYPTLHLPVLTHLTAAISSTCTIVVLHSLRLLALITLHLLVSQPHVFQNLAILCESVFANTLHLKLSVSCVSPRALATLLFAMPRLVSLDTTDSSLELHDALREATAKHPQLHCFGPLQTTQQG